MSKKKAKAKDKAKPRALYEAADPRVVPAHKSWRDHRDGDATVAMAGTRLRNFARHLDQNHDLSRGALDRLVQMVIGPNGIAIEPLPRTKDGKIYRTLAEDMSGLWDDWTQWPDVTWEHDWLSVQQMLGRSLFRDGEVLTQLVHGDKPNLDHGTLVPFSLEMIEADQLPLDLNDAARGITQGIERNVWGRPRAYHLSYQHPGGLQPAITTTSPLIGQYKRVPFENMLHLKLVDRIKQARGVTKFAAVIRRLSDIKDYEDSERIAAKFAANLTAYIKKTMPELMPDGYDYSSATDPNSPRAFPSQPGMVFDDLRPGEDVGLIDSKRPNPNVESFRSGQLRAAAAGLGVSYSSLARDYDGTYSAQRQELVEQQSAYETLTALFIGQFVRQVWQRFIETAQIANLITLPADLNLATLAKAAYRGPAMLWIDPLKEISAHVMAKDNYLASPQKIIRQRGDNPDDVLTQIQDWNQQLDDKRIPRLLSGSQLLTPKDFLHDVVSDTSRRR